MELVDLARTNPDFKRRARADLEGALSEYGYELTEEELAAVKEFNGRSRGMSDVELSRARARSARDPVMRGS